MKKSIVFSLIVTTLLCVLNWIMASMLDKCIGITLRGGEYHASYGFGILLEEFYPLTTTDDPIKYTNKISFDPISFVVTFLILFTIFMVIGIVSRKKHLSGASL